MTNESTPPAASSGAEPADTATGPRVYNPYVVLLWVLAIAASIGAIVLYVLGLKSTNTLDYSSSADLVSASTAKASEVEIANALLVVFAVLAAAAMTVCALRWREKA